MTALYNLLLTLLSPLAVLRLLFKSRSNPAYRERIAERFALRLPKAPAGAVWVHTVSVGEFLAIIPLLDELRRRCPSLPLWITCTTPTGRAQIARWQAAQTAPTVISYLPYDSPCAVRRFYRHVQPAAAIFMETEIWPNLLKEAQRRQIPAMLINARLSAKSLRGYKKYAAKLLQKPLKNLNINAQTRQDAKRFRVLNPKAHITVTPSLKYAAPAAAAEALSDFLPAGAPLLLAASTHAGEDTLMIETWQNLRKTQPELRLCIAPRHPERRAEIVKLIETAGFAPVLRNKGETQNSANDIAILDTLGELSRAYASASAAVIGGSFIERGGHNPLEALHAGTPACFGPSMFNFQAIAAAISKEPFVRHSSRQTLAADIRALLDYYAAYGRAPVLAYSRRQSADILRRHAAYVQNRLPTRPP